MKPISTEELNILTRNVKTSPDTFCPLLRFIPEPEDAWAKNLHRVFVALEKEKYLKQAPESGHFVLNNADFDRLAVELQSDREPSEKRVNK